MAGGELVAGEVHGRVPRVRLLEEAALALVAGAVLTDFKDAGEFRGAAELAGERRELLAEVRKLVLDPT